MWRRDGRRTALSQQPSSASFQQRHDARGAVKGERLAISPRAVSRFTSKVWLALCGRTESYSPPDGNWQPFSREKRTRPSHLSWDGLQEEHQGPPELEKIPNAEPTSDTGRASRRQCRRRPSIDEVFAFQTRLEKRDDVRCVAVSDIILNARGNCAAGGFGSGASACAGPWPRFAECARA